MLVHHDRMPLAHMLTWGLLPSGLKVLLYRLRGAQIGRRVKLGVGSVILGARSIRIGDDSSIGAFTSISCRRLEIGKRVQVRSLVTIQVRQATLGDDVIISETTIIRALMPGPRSRIILGDRTHIQPYCVIDPTELVEMEGEVAVGLCAHIFTHASFKSKLDGYAVTLGEVHIGQRVWLGSRVAIMPSVTIGDDAVIGAGSLVNRDVASGVLAAGVPAKEIKAREEFVKVVSRDEKREILREIMEEFRHYLQDDGLEVTEHASAEDWFVWDLGRRARGGSARWRLAFSLGERSSGVALPPGIDAFLSLGPLGEPERREIEFRGAAWFDVEAKQRSKQSNDLADEVAYFLGRYGIYCARP